MNCREYSELMSEYIDGRLPVEDSAAIAAHLEQCANCRAVEEELRATVSLVSGLERLEAPEGFADGVKARLERRLLIEGPVRGRRRRLLPWSLGGVALAAAAAILMVAFVHYGRDTEEIARPREPYMSDSWDQSAVEGKAGAYEDHLALESGPAERLDRDTDVVVAHKKERAEEGGALTVDRADRLYGDADVGGVDKKEGTAGPATTVEGFADFRGEKDVARKESAGAAPVLEEAERELYSRTDVVAKDSQQRLARRTESAEASQNGRVLAALPPETKANGPVDEETRQRLKSLGYVGDDAPVEDDKASFAELESKVAVGSEEVTERENAAGTRGVSGKGGVATAPADANYAFDTTAKRKVEVPATPPAEEPVLGGEFIARAPAPDESAKGVLRDKVEAEVPRMEFHSEKGAIQAVHLFANNLVPPEKQLKVEKPSVDELKTFLGANGIVVLELADEKSVIQAD
ncbi:MAG: anti-sigma factor family protein, partial [Planctomycetota bacterium]